MRKEQTNSKRKPETANHHQRQKENKKKSNFQVVNVHSCIKKRRYTLEKKLKHKQAIRGANYIEIEKILKITTV